MKKSSFVSLSLFFCCLSSRALASDGPRAILTLGGISGGRGDLTCFQKSRPEGGFTHTATTTLKTGNPLISIVFKNYRVWSNSLDIHFVIGVNFSGPFHRDQWEVQDPRTMFLAGNVRTTVGKANIYESGALIPQAVCPRRLPPFSPSGSPSSPSASLPPLSPLSDTPQAYPCPNPAYPFPFPTCSPASVARYSKKKLVVEVITGGP